MDPFSIQRTKYRPIFIQFVYECLSMLYRQLVQNIFLTSPVQVIGFDWLQLYAVIPSSLASLDSSTSSNGSLCSSACDAVLLQQSRKNFFSKNSDFSSVCDSFWCRENPSAWGAMAASDAQKLHPNKWDQFESSGQLGNFQLRIYVCTFILIYLTVL